MKEFFKTLKEIISILPKEKNTKLPFIVFLLFLQSIFEIIGLGAIFPVILSIFDTTFHIDNLIGKFIYEFLGFTHRNDLILFFSVCLLFLIIIKNILSLLIIKYCSKFSYSIYRDLAIKLHGAYYKKGFLFFTDTNSSTIWRDINQATFWFGSMQVMGALIIINEIILTLLICSAIVFYNFKVALLLAFLVFPPFYLFYMWVQKRSLNLGLQRKIIIPQLTKNYYQAIHGYTDIMISGKQTYFANKIKNKIKDLIEVEVESTVNNYAPSKIIETALMFSICAITIYGIYFLENTNEIISTLSLLAIAGYRLTPSINRIVTSLNSMTQTKWVFPIILENISNTLREKTKDIDLIFKNKLHLKKISFSYPNKKNKILDDFSLIINKGEKLGIKGESGSGKTTILNIILGFLSPTSGSYFIDDRELTQSTLASFRTKIGYVNQHVFLLDGTIKENIAFGIDDSDINIKFLETVLKQAKLWNVVKEMPNGINENIGENGVKLSGGQRQRIGIARALYQQAEILIFDEATSALDNITEREITNSIKNLTKSNLTIIIIAHRETSLKYCDRIIDLSKK